MFSILTYTIVKIERLSELKKTQFALLVQQETTYSG